MEGRSIWTGRRSASLVAVDVDARTLLGGRWGEGELLVEPQHEAELRDFVAYAARTKTRFWILFGVGLLLAVAGGLLSNVVFEAVWAVAVSLLIFGVTMVLYPFATPQTIRLVGMKPSRTMVRWGSLLMFGMAIWIASLALSG